MRKFFVTGEDLAGNVTPDANADSLQIFLDTQGPQITNVQITGSPDYSLFGMKANVYGHRGERSGQQYLVLGNRNAHVAPRAIAVDGGQRLRRPFPDVHLGGPHGTALTITGYVAATHTFTVSPALSSAPSVNDSFQIDGNAVQGPTPLVIR